MSQSSVLETKDLCLSYGDTQVVNNVSVAFAEKSVTAMIGPSGCGKSTLLENFQSDE